MRHGEAWRAAVRGVAESRILLRDGTATRCQGRGWGTESCLETQSKTEGGCCCFPRVTSPGLHGLFFPLLVMLPSEIPKLPSDPLVRCFLVFGNFSFMTPFQGWVSITNSFASLLVFYILSDLLSKRTYCLSGCLASSASVQKLFCGGCSAFK